MKHTGENRMDEIETNHKRIQQDAEEVKKAGKEIDENIAKLTRFLDDERN